MPLTNRYYRLRILTADGLSDEVVISSVPGDDNPFLLEAPNGDGMSFDPLTGKITTGTYTVRVIDNGRAANAITPILADADARQQLLSRVGIVEIGADGITWPEELQHGYVNAIRLGIAAAFDFSIGDTQRKEVSQDVFREATALLGGTTSIIGGPIRGGFGPIRDYGGWRYTVNQVATTPDYVQLKIVPGKIFDPRKANASGQFRNLATVSTALANYTNSVARPFFEPSSVWATSFIQGRFPGLEILVQETDGTVVGFFTPLSEPLPNAGSWWTQGLVYDLLMRSGQSSLWIDNLNGLAPDGVTPLAWTPTVAHQYDVYVYIKAIGPENPLHYVGHPVDLWELIRLDAAIPYDASVLPAVKAAVGNDVKVELRIIQSYKIGEFDTAVIYGPFGLSTRMVGGERQLFSSRLRSSTVPTATLTVADLKEETKGGKPFDLDEATAIKRVTLKQQRLVPWTSEEVDQPNADALIAIPSTTSIDNSDDDATVTGAGEVTYEIPGQITIAGAYAGKFGPRLRQIGWLAGVADEVFDRWGRGIIGGEFQCLPSVTALIGEELLATLPHMPVSVIGESPVTQRGLTRIIQVVGRTETPSGPNIKWLDAGSAGDTAPGDTSSLLVPTFTIAANSDDPRKYADVTITNGPAIAALGGRIRVWVATGTAPASGSGSLATIIDPAVDDLTFTLPAFDAGTHVHVQLQTVVTDQRPSVLSAFDDVQLDVIDPPTGLAATAQDAGDPSRRMLSWTVGTNAADIPVEVSIRLTAETSAANRVVAVLPPGSTQFELTGLDTENRTASVRHRESPPFSGASTYATVAVNTTGAFRTLNPPTSPRGFTTADGTYGMDVIATEFPSQVEFQVKTGIGGTFETIAIVDSEESGRTGFTDVAPNDGEVRYMRARHISDGLTESAWTATVSVTSWDTDPPPTDPPATTAEAGYAHTFLHMGA